MQARQLGLFDKPSLNIAADIADVMRTAASNCGLSRDQIVDAMNHTATQYGISLVNGNGRGLTLDTLEKWLNPRDISRTISLRALPVFCAVVQDYAALDIVARPLGLQVIGPEDQKRLAWAKEAQRAKEARARMRALERDF